MVKQIFVNLPVKDLDKTKNFFSSLGFSFNPQFTDNNAACMIISENIYAMLLTEKMFKTFIKKDIVDAKKSTEVLLAINCESKEEVDDMIEKVVNAGGKPTGKGEDLEWMYSKSFEDLDGHIWEPFFFDEQKFPSK